MLDNIRSAYNVGAIMRTADGAGVNRIHLLGITPTPDNPKVQKTALGAGTTIAWSQYWSYSEFLAQNQRYQYQVLGLEGGQQSSPLFDLPVNSDFHYLLVIGNEIQGINPEIISDANSIVYLPMLGAKRSLNVSVACSIALYWLRFISQGRDGR
ncbi:MAG: TrmH family RNA methyltransferase [Anaerolineae bacterium]|nr:TrmH family RNA methyltransferase [Anaerolineae bacterium]